MAKDGMAIKISELKYQMTQESHMFFKQHKIFVLKKSHTNAQESIAPPHSSITAQFMQVSHPYSNSMEFTT